MSLLADRLKALAHLDLADDVKSTTAEQLEIFSNAIATGNEVALDGSAQILAALLANAPSITLLADVLAEYAESLLSKLGVLITVGFCVRSEGIGAVGSQGTRYEWVGSARRS